MKAVALGIKRQPLTCAILVLPVQADSTWVEKKATEDHKLLWGGRSPCVLRRARTGKRACSLLWPQVDKEQQLLGLCGGWISLLHILFLRRATHREAVAQGLWFSAAVGCVGAVWKYSWVRKQEPSCWRSFSQKSVGTGERKGAAVVTAVLVF